jgi:hypothetical protein
VFYQIPESFVDLGTKLDLLSCFEDTSPDDIQGELTELVVLRTGLQRVSIVAKAKACLASSFWLFFGFVSLLVFLMLVTLHLLGKAQRPLLRSV